MSCVVSTLEVETLEVETLKVETLKVDEVETLKVDEVETLDLCAIEDSISRQMLLTKQLEKIRAKSAETTKTALHSSPPVNGAATGAATVAAPKTSSMNLHDQTKRSVKKRKLSCAPTLEDKALISTLDALCSY